MNALSTKNAHVYNDRNGMFSATYRQYGIGVYDCRRWGEASYTIIRTLNFRVGTNRVSLYLGKMRKGKFKVRQSGGPQ